MDNIYLKNVTDQNGNKELLKYRVRALLLPQTSFFSGVCQEKTLEVLEMEILFIMC